MDDRYDAVLTDSEIELKKAVNRFCRHLPSGARECEAWSSIHNMLKELGQATFSS